MLEIKGNLWDWHDKGYWIAITTNGVIRMDGACVMGRGIARQAKNKFPQLPYDLGNSIQAGGNQVHQFSKYQIYTLPVKHHWRERADLDLIVRSCHQLNSIAEKTYMVRPGCGNGGMLWDVVKPAIENILDDRFIIVEIR